MILCASAESTGFEPAKRVTACLVSNEVVSSTHPTLHKHSIFTRGGVRSYHRGTPIPMQDSCATLLFAFHGGINKTRPHRPTYTLLALAGMVTAPAAECG